MEKRVKGKAAERMKCANCEHNDGMVYLSLPPTYRCTITNEFHFGGDDCNMEFAPVKHGRWIPSKDGHGCECSECGTAYGWIEADTMKYCKRCGARKDGGEE